MKTISLPLYTFCNLNFRRWKRNWNTRDKQWSEIAHSCLTLWNSSVQNTGVSSLSLLQGVFLTQGLNPGLPHYRRILNQLSHKGSPRILKWVAYPFSSRSSWPRNQTRVSCIAGTFFTSWAIREVLDTSKRQTDGYTITNLTRPEKYITYFLHCLICSGFVYSFRHSVIWSPIFIKHCLVCSSCSLSERPLSGLSSCFSAALTGLILSLHWNRKRRAELRIKGMDPTQSHCFQWHFYTSKGNIKWTLNSASQLLNVQNFPLRLYSESKVFHYHLKINLCVSKSLGFYLLLKKNSSFLHCSTPFQTASMLKDKIFQSVT